VNDVLTNGRFSLHLRRYQLLIFDYGVGNGRFPYLNPLGTLVIDLLECVAFAIKLVANPSTDGRGHHQLAATIGTY
jgi:hypothetical protein